MSGSGVQRKEKLGCLRPHPHILGLCSNPLSLPPLLAPPPYWALALGTRGILVTPPSHQAPGINPQTRLLLLGCAGPGPAPQTHRPVSGASQASHWTHPAHHLDSWAPGLPHDLSGPTQAAGESFPGAPVMWRRCQQPPSQTGNAGTAL